MELARTNMTGLSDDELVICDSLWPYEHSVPLKYLYQDIFPDIANLPHNHTIPDQDLESVLDSMVARGILRTETRILTTRNGVPPYPHRVFGLTTEGGLTWEIERTPNWQLYVNVESDDLDESLNVVSCLSEEIGRKFIQAQIRSGYWQIAGTYKHSLVPRAPLVPWKQFTDVHQFRVLLATEAERTLLDREVYESERVWWSCTHELFRSPKNFQNEI
jgi:hypothetical protein